MFTNEEINEMFRMGTLNGVQINRSKYHTIKNQYAEITKCVVFVNRQIFEISRVFPYKENRENAKNDNELTKITVYYKIKTLE